MLGLLGARYHGDLSNSSGTVHKSFFASDLYSLLSLPVDQGLKPVKYADLVEGPI